MIETTGLVVQFGDERWVAILIAERHRVVLQAPTAELLAEAAFSKAGELWPGSRLILMTWNGTPWTPQSPDARTGIAEPDPLVHGPRSIVDRCPACEHEWDEHRANPGQCSECLYEMEHKNRHRLDEPCPLLPPDAARAPL